MKVVHCIANMLGGGAERQCALLAAAQVARGDAVHVALIAGGPNLPWLERSGAALHWIAARSYHDPRILAQLGRVIRAVAPDVIQTWLLQMDVAGGISASRAGVPWVLSERAAAGLYPSSVKVWARRLVARRCATVVANSAAGASYWRQALDGRVPTHVIPNIVPLDAIDAAVASSAAVDGPTRPLVLFAGRLAAQKNVLLLVDALARVLPEAGACALICGEGPDEPAIRERIAARGMGDRITLGGFREDLWAVMARSAVVVSVSRFEGHPNVVLEAMACGTPVVVSEIPEHREFLDDGSAWFADPADVSAVAAAIAAALRDREGARRRAARARDLVSTLTAERCAERYDAVYRTVLRPR